VGPGAAGVLLVHTGPAGAFVFLGACVLGTFAIAARIFRPVADGHHT
jgi:hypothetical protein